MLQQLSANLYINCTGFHHVEQHGVHAMHQAEVLIKSVAPHCQLCDTVLSQSSSLTQVWIKTQLA
jgi:hypothetical protein